MDDRERIAKLEATMDAYSQRFDRIDQTLVRLEDRMERGFREQREYIDRSLAELRSELTKTTRWMIGILVTYGIAIVGLVVKAGFGS